MATLTSASTDAQVIAAYEDNCSYAEDDSITKALAFKTAVMFYIRRFPVSSGREGQNVSFESLKTQLEEVNSFIAANRSSSQPRERFAGFEDFRDY